MTNPPNRQSGLQDRLDRDPARNVEQIRALMRAPGDLITRTFRIGITGLQCAVVCIDGLYDKELIQETVILTFQRADAAVRERLGQADDPLAVLENGLLSASDLTRARTMDDALLAILSGDTALFVEGTEEALLIDSKKWAGRSVEEPVTDVRGPREGFTENIRTNTTLIRRHIRDPNLRFETYKIGRRSRKDLVLTYVEGIVHPDLVQEAKRRLATIDLDDAPESGYIEQWIEDSFLSPFPQVAHTERPDKLSTAILQGKVGILLDGTPFGLILPTTFVSLIQSPEDYYERWLIGTLIRVLRYIAMFIAVFLPALYIALVSYHQGMIPSRLAFSIAAAREGVPFPAVVEAFLMEATLELLREAGVRLPKPIGQTIGIVGGLVIGEAAVQASIVSPIMVIVVSVTAISSFAIPSYSAGIAFRMMRFAVMLAAGAFGLFGIILAYIMINIHLVRLYNFGIPYATPFSPFFKQDWKDVVIRAPLQLFTTRPAYLQTVDKKSQSRGRSGGEGGAR